MWHTLQLLMLVILYPFIFHSLLLAAYLDLKLKANIYHTLFEIQQGFYIISLLTAETSQEKAAQKNTVLYTNSFSEVTL